MAKGVASIIGKKRFSDFSDCGLPPIDLSVILTNEFRNFRGHIRFGASDMRILTGEMSFIGPRPLLPVDQPAAYAARLHVRPGLTGWAQVKGGREISAADKAALDVWYTQNASLALDLEIIARTVTMVLFGEGVDVIAIQRAWRELQQAGICTSLQSNIGGAVRQGRLPHERRDRSDARRSHSRAEHRDGPRQFFG